MKTAELLARLERHYIKPGQPLPGGVFVPECGRNGGASQSRCDALYVGFTSTSGRLLVGHELKVSRADWRHELDQHGKADVWADDCHEWYVVAPSTDVVPPEELPDGWGLMVPSARTKTRMQVVRPAVTHRDHTPSWATVRSIIARQDTLRANVIAQVKRDAFDQARAEHEQRQQDARRVGTAMSHKDQERLAMVERLEAALDVTLQPYVWSGDTSPNNAIEPRELAAALNIVRAARKLPHANLVDRHARDFETLAMNLRGLIEALGEYADLKGGAR